MRRRHRTSCTAPSPHCPRLASDASRETPRKLIWKNPCDSFICYSTIMEDLPTDFVLYTEWPEYLEDKMLPSWIPAPLWVGERPRGLQRNFLGLFFSETYTTHEEPVLEASSGRGRLVIWQPLNRSDIPPRWRRSTFWDVFLQTRRDYKEGYVGLDAGPELWSATQRRMRRRWIATMLNQTHVIRVVTREEFLDAYKKSRTWARIEKYHSEYLLKKSALDAGAGRHISYRVVCDTRSNEIIAGLATLDSPTHKSSYYFMAFVHSQDNKIPAMTGLVDDWCTRSREKGFSTIQFGRFRSPRNTKIHKDWEGFSLFKSTFGTRYIEFSPVLYRYIRGRSGA